MNPSTRPAEERGSTRRHDTSITVALRMLGKTDMLLAVHDASFPAAKGEDTGRGTPYSVGGLSFCVFAAELGFTGLQLGPQGQTSQINASPYDGTLFSRNILSLDLKALVDQQLLSHHTWERILSENPCLDGRRVPYATALRAYDSALNEAYRTMVAARESGVPEALSLDREIKELWESARWVRDDGLYEALTRDYGDLPWRQWPQVFDQNLCAHHTGTEPACFNRRRMLVERHTGMLERYTMAQLLLLRQHSAFRSGMQRLGLKIYGDVQVGFSVCDTWSLQGLLLRNYFMGAPPSRTNSEGQPWSYQVLDPEQYLDINGGSGPVLGLVAERLGKMLSEFDGLRLDHPHGLVCPWVYRIDDPDPFHAVQNGARLFSSPDLADHPELARYAIVPPNRLNRERPRFADDWVNDITPQEEDRYALIMDTLMEQVLAHGRRKEDILFEVLSTEPLPLRRVRQRHGLGRFRVTQKADLENPEDVYRSENADPEDWIMVGNHDTPSVWKLAKAWQGTEEGRRQASYLARRLRPGNPGRLEAALLSDYRRLVHAKLADIFLSPARHVMLFFADLLGIEESYNIPGTRNEENWTLRVPPDFGRRYREGSRRGEVINLHAVLALALRARSDISCPELITRLETEAGWRIDAEEID